jgi:hypothetical protein
MKAHFPFLRTVDGNVLIITMVAAMLIGMTLASYLSMVRNEDSMVARSQAWNAALVAAEAGIEEAFANANNGMPRLRSAGSAWSASRPLSGGSYSAAYASYASNGAPVLYATGYCTVPSLSATLTRVVRVQTSASSLWSSALVASNLIDLKGNNISTDSYNSTNGPYASAPHGTNGDVISINGLVNVGNADISGDVLLGAGDTNSLQAITNSIKNNGFVTGTIANDFNMDISEVSVPLDFNPTLLQSGGVSNYISLSGDYNMTQFKPSDSLVVPSNVTARLYITGDVKITGPPGITIQPGGSLTLYMGGANFSVDGGGIVNGGKPGNFSYFGLPTNTQISMGGNANFSGTIYAPNADFSGGSGNAQVYGSILVKSATLTGNYAFHYDESLLNSGIIRGYIGASWQEL